METLIWILALLMILVGILGTVVPLIPGAPLVFTGIFLAAWQDGFSKVGWITLILLAALTVASLLVDMAAAAIGARKSGATRAAAFGAIAGTMVGIFFALPGLILGPFIGAVGGELLAGKDLPKAGKAGFGTWIGLILGTAFKVALVFAMTGIFLTMWLIN